LQLQHDIEAALPKRKEGVVFLKMKSFLCFQMHQNCQNIHEEVVPKGTPCSLNHSEKIQVVAPMNSNIIPSFCTEGTTKKKVISCFFIALITENTVEIAALIQKAFSS
jgi:hypothetical protein